MKNWISVVLICAIGILFPQIIFSEQNRGEVKDNRGDSITEEENNKDDDKKKKKRWGLIPFGLPYYTPDTGAALMAAIVIYHNPNPDDPGQKPDEYTLGGTYTLRNQMALSIDANVYFLKEVVKISGNVAVARYPQDFWGIGPRTKDYMKEKYTPISINAEPSLLFKVINNLYIGPMMHVCYVEIKRERNSFLLRTDSIPGCHGGVVSGLGIGLNWDNRDNIFYPHKGFYFDVKGLMYRQEIGSKYNYTRIDADFRSFIQLYQEVILAIQIYAKMHWGTVPFFTISELGSMNIMRGYLQGRYKDKNFLASQIELRFPIYKRLSAVFFGSIGSVTPRLDEVHHYPIRYSWGPGLRFLADKNEHINIRLDCGFDENLNPNFYFFIKEAF